MYGEWDSRFTGPETAKHFKKFDRDVYTPGCLFQMPKKIQLIPFRPGTVN